MAVSKEPPKKNVTPIDERQIEKIINKGGSTMKEANQEATENLHGINVKFTGQELENIKILREKRPKDPRRKLPISLQAWILEAVKEKIERENKKYSLA